MDTRCCKYCGVEFSKFIDYEGTFDEGYCCKFHRADHEKQLIKEGKLESVKDFTNGLGLSIMKDTQYTDALGQPIWFPKDERAYYDKFLGRTFHSKKEKSEYMKANNKIMTGEESKPWPIESGDMRSKSYRRQIKAED